MSLSKFYNDIGLHLNSDKTQCILFSRKHNPSQWNINLDGLSLAQKDVIKYLGVHFNRKLNWSSHVKNIVVNCRKRLNLLRCLCGIKWGAHPDALLTIYKCFIRPLLEYGCACFSVIPKTLLLRLERIQYCALRISMGLMQSTHTKTLEMLGGVLPLNVRFDFLNYRYINGLYFKSNHSLISRLEILSSITNVMKVLPVFIKVQNSMEGNSNYEDIYEFKREALYFKPKINDSVRQVVLNKNETNNTIVQQKFRASVESFNSEKIIFTDGSRQNDVYGIGVYQSPNTELKFKLNFPCSIFTAELTAIYLAGLEIQKQIPSKYLIATDSLSGIEAFKNVKAPHKSNIRLIECRNVF